jgi:ParB-like chromosome segregation protein Spo0J/DNA modification methylase
VQTIELSKILILDRQRYELGDLERLATSLKEHGQIHPILLRQSDSRLVAGGRRCAATELLASRGETIRGFALGTIAYSFRETLSDEELAELELEENIRRKSLTWQENVFAICKLHKLYTQRGVMEGKKWGQRETGELLGVSTTPVFNALKLAEYLERDRNKGGIWLCESPSDAIRFILREQEDAATAEKARRTLANLEPSTQGDEVLSDYDNLEDVPEETIDLTQPPPYIERDETGRRKRLFLWDNKDEAKKSYEKNVLNTMPWEEYLTKSLEAWKAEKDIVPLSSLVFNIDCLTFMKEHLDCYDHIITDPPYGIEMKNLSQENSGMENIDQVSKEHDVEENLILLDQFIKASWLSLKEKGFLVMFCDAMNFRALHDLAVATGFRVQRWPFVWHKTHACLNQMAGFNTTKNFEFAIICRKPNSQLITPCSSSVLSCPNDATRDSGHPFAKPESLWQKLATHLSYEGQLILEPFAGRGSGTLSMLSIGRRVVSCESNEVHFAHLVENLKQHYIKTIGDHVRFK